MAPFVSAIFDISTIPDAELGSYWPDLTRLSALMPEELGSTRASSKAGVIGTITL